MVKNGIGACLLFDPINIRYALDTTNMSLYTMHNLSRYCFIPSQGEITLFEFHQCGHVAKHLKLIDNIKFATCWEYPLVGKNSMDNLAKMTSEIQNLLIKWCGENRRLAVDSLDVQAVFAFAKLNIELCDGKKMMEEARQIKNEDEITCLKAAIDVAELGLAEVRKQLQAGITEEELWAHFHKVNIENGGEWIETRLLTSGVRTNPWMSECSNKIIESGDIVAIDTDMVGPYGYTADISRTFVEGHIFSPYQKKLYKIAMNQIEHNASLITPGLTFKEFTEQSFQLPRDFIKNRYTCVLHGIGLADEYPYIPYPEDGSELEGVFEENMVLCLESYIAEENGKEGVKLEQVYVVRGDGLELLSHFPFEQI
jgi:Xaa-Pro aminopeptidase